MISTTSFNNALNNYLAHLQANDKFSNTDGYNYSDGKRYCKVYREYLGGTQKTVISFVDKETGIIYKAKDWKSASKTVLGHINNYLEVEALEAPQEPVVEIIEPIVEAIETTQESELLAAVEIAQKPEVQVHPEIESQEIELMALEAKLEQDCSEEVLPEASQNNEQVTTADEVMSPQEQLIDSTQLRESSAAQDDQLGRMLAEGLKEIADKHETKAKSKAKLKRESSENYAKAANSQVKAVKEGTKIAAIIDLLKDGTTLDTVNEAVGKVMTVSYIARRLALRGYGIKSENGYIRLVLPENTELPAHRVTTKV